MLITISALACFPQSVSTDIFCRPWRFNTFAVTEMPGQSLSGNICWNQEISRDRALCSGGWHTATSLMKGRTVFLGHVCRKMGLGDAASPRQASLSCGLAGSDLGLTFTQEEGSRWRAVSKRSRLKPTHVCTACQVARVWADPICRQIIGLEMLTRHLIAAGKEDSQGFRSQLCPLGGAVLDV